MINVISSHLATGSLEPTNDPLVVTTKQSARPLLGSVVHQVSESRSLLISIKPESPSCHSSQHVMARASNMAARVSSCDLPHTIPTAGTWRKVHTHWHTKRRRLSQAYFSTPWLLVHTLRGSREANFTRAHHRNHHASIKPNRKN